MLIRFGLGGQLSGSVGGVVAGHNKGGQYLRNRSIPVNPNSERQLAVRQGLSAASINWRALTDAQRDAWGAYAAETPLVNSLGESITVSGFNMYVRTNAYLTGIGQAQLTAAPTSPGSSSLGTPAGTPFVASVADGVTFAVTGANATRASSCIVQYGPPLSAGVSFFKAPYSLFATVTMAATGFDELAQSDAQYGILVVGQRRPFRVRSMDSTGRLSNVYETIVTCAA